MSRELSQIAESIAKMFNDRVLFEQNNQDDFKKLIQITNIIHVKIVDLLLIIKHFIIHMVLVKIVEID